MTNALAAMAEFSAGYAVILLTPGPNLLAVGSIAALRGLRAALPFCLGVAAGAGVLCAAVALATGPACGPLTAGTLARAAGGLLLGWVALSVGRGPAPADSREPAAGAAAPAGAGNLAALGGGFLTAATNPVTGAFFVSQFVAPTDATRDATLRAGAIPCVVALALAVFLAVAALLARPAIRRAALRWNRPVRLAAASVLGTMAVRALWPLAAG